MTLISLYKPSRRQLLLGTSAAGIAALGTGAWILSGEPENFITSVIKDALPYIDFEDGIIEEFAVLYYDRVTDQRRGNIDKITKIYRGIGLPGVRALLRENEKYTNFRRTMVSEFLIETDYFSADRDPQAKVSYIGQNPCARNPFAQFS